MYGKVRRFHWDRKSNTIKCVEAIVWIRRLLLYIKKERKKKDKLPCSNEASCTTLLLQRFWWFSVYTAPLGGQFACCTRSVQVVISTSFKGLLAQGLGVLRPGEGGSGDENSCLLWLVAASARSGKSVEQEPSCESPRGNKSFLTSPLTHHTAAQNKACVSALLLCVNVHICAGTSSVCECRCVYAAGSVFYSTPWNNVPLLRMGCFTLYE